MQLNVCIFDHGMLQIPLYDGNNWSTNNDDMPHLLLSLLNGILRSN